ncbi:MAG: hypothetical protein DME50_10390 [Verrucomicrobia bacterium]|nr:MAG: hypothetical protein DME85_05120 [Verrucomicrobiota bacterium]PYK65030.1 MAG: hypothetical protein DME50_10390 [Verrucomicrobiota bacterium]
MVQKPRGARMDEPAKVVSGVAVSTTLIVPKEYKQIGCSRGGIAHRKEHRSRHGCLHRKLR